MRREICAGKNEKGKSKKCKEHIFKLDFQGEISNKQPLISDCRKISGNIGTGIHTVTISVVCVYRKWYIGKVTGKIPKVFGSYQVWKGM